MDAGLGAGLGVVGGGVGKAAVSGTRALKNFAQRQRNPDIGVAQKFQEAAGGQTADDLAKLLSNEDLTLADVDPKFRATLNKSARGGDRREIRNVLDARDSKAAVRVAQARGRAGLPSLEQRRFDLNGAQQQEIQEAFSAASEALDPTLNLQLPALRNLRSRPRVGEAARAAEQDIFTEFGRVEDPDTRARIALRMAVNRFRDADGAVRVGGREIDLTKVDEKTREVFTRYARDILNGPEEALTVGAFPLNFLDAWRKQLGAQIGGKFANNPSAGRALNEARKQLVDTVDEMAEANLSGRALPGRSGQEAPGNPYKAFRDLARTRKMQIDAIDMGRNLLTTGKPKDVMQVIEDEGYLKIPDVARDLAVGIMEGAEALASTGNLSAGRVRNLINTGPKRETMTRILGPRGVKQLEALAESEGQMAKTTKQLAGSEPVPEPFPGIQGSVPLGGWRFTAARGGEQAIDAVTDPRRAGQTQALARSMMLGRGDVPRIEELLKPRQTPNPLWEYGAAGPYIQPWASDF